MSVEHKLSTNKLADIKPGECEAVKHIHTAEEMKMVGFFSLRRN